MFVFTLRPASGGSKDQSTSLYFSYRDPSNSYCIEVTRRALALHKTLNGKKVRFAARRLLLPDNLAELRIAVQRKREEIVTAVNGKFAFRVRDESFHGPLVRASARGGFKVTDSRVQPLGEIIFSDDFMRAEPSGRWKPVSGAWEIVSKQWSERSVNPFSLFARFKDSPRFSKLLEGRTRRYLGFGMRVEYEGGLTKVVHVFDDTPADEAGLRSDDIIVEVNGRSAVGRARDDLLKWFAPRPGKTVRVKVRRRVAGEEKVLSFELRPRRIDLDNTSSRARMDPYRVSDRALILGGYDFWSDYDFEVSARSLGGGAMGLVFYAGGGNYYLFRWTGETGGPDADRLSLLRVSGKDTATLAERKGGFVPGQYYRLGVRIRGTRVTATVDGVKMLSAEVPDLTWGGIGLYAERSRGVYFDDVSVRSSDAPPPPPRRPSFGRTFAGDTYMKDWASRASDWIEDRKQQMFWHRFAFPGDTSFRFEPARREVWNHPLRLIINADRARAARGYHLVLHGVRRTAEIFREQRRVAGPFELPREMKSVVFESRSGKVAVIANGVVAGTYADPLPLDGAHVGVAGVQVTSDEVLLGLLRTSVSPDELYVNSSGVLDYGFRSAPTDWHIACGNWGIMNRWVCDPRWSWFGGRSRSTAAIWHKRSFSGDVWVDVFAALEMPSYWKSPHERPGDICITICGDGDNFGSGYALIVAGEDNSWTRLYRRGKVVAETRSPLFLLPRRERSFRTAMRLHRNWYHLRLQKEGRRVSFFMNGQLGFRFLDEDPIEGGKVALWTINNGILIARARIAAQHLGPLDVPFASKRPFTSGGISNLVGGRISSNVRPLADRPGYYEVTNAEGGGNFAVALMPGTIDASRSREIAFDYKIDPSVKVDVYFDLDGARHRLRFTGPGRGEDAFITLGAFPGVKADGQWHRTSFRLYAHLRDRYPYRDEFILKNLQIANYSNRDYLLAGSGANRKGASYCIGKLRLSPDTATDSIPPTVRAIRFPFEDEGNASEIRFILNDVGGSDIDIRTARIIVNGKTFSVKDDAVRYEYVPRVLRLDLPAAGITLKDGEVVRAELSHLRDFAGNELARPASRSWRFDISTDKTPPRDIRVQFGKKPILRWDFENGPGGWYSVGLRRKTLPGKSGGWLRIEKHEDGSGHYLRVQNLRMAVDFGAGFLSKPRDLGRYPLLTFRYAISREVPVDISLDLHGERDVIAFAAHSFRQDLIHYGKFKTIGAVPRVVQDSKWHSASANLFRAVVTHHPDAKDFKIKDIHFGDDVTGYLGNYEGAYFCLDDVELRPLLGRADLRPSWRASDISGISDYRCALNDKCDYVPTGKTIAEDISKAHDGLSYFHLMLRDGAGNWSEPIHEMVYLDVTPPCALDLYPVQDLAYTFVIEFDERVGLDPQSIVLKVAGRRYTVDGKVMWYNQLHRELTWRAGKKDRKTLQGRKSVKVELLSAADFAGNPIVTPRTWSWKPTAP